MDLEAYLGNVEAQANDNRVRVTRMLSLSLLFADLILMYAAKDRIEFNAARHVNGNSGYFGMESWLLYGQSRMFECRFPILQQVIGLPAPITCNPIPRT
nr:hypothetical protein CFP56_36323 [Quercus suber]